MEDPNVPIICRVCKRSVPMKEIRFDETRKAYVCKTCFDNSHRKISEQLNVAPLRTRSEEKSVFVSEETQKSVKYICPDCKYEFQRKEGKRVRECPYCGSKNIMRAIDVGADKLVDET